MSAIFSSHTFSPFPTFGRVARSAWRAGSLREVFTHHGGSSGLFLVVRFASQARAARFAARWPSIIEADGYTVLVSIFNPTHGIYPVGLRVRSWSNFRSFLLSSGCWY